MADGGAGIPHAGGMRRGQGMPVTHRPIISARIPHRGIIVSRLSGATLMIDTSMEDHDTSFARLLRIGTSLALFPEYLQWQIALEEETARRKACGVPDSWVGTTADWLYVQSIGTTPDIPALMRAAQQLNVLANGTRTDGPRRKQRRAAKRKRR